MPEIPITYARPGLPEVNYPRASRDAFGYSGLGDLAAQFQAIGEAAEEAESKRLIAEAKARMDDAVRQNKEKIVNPGDFHKTTTDAIKEIHKSSLESASIGSVRAKVQAALSPYMIRSQTAIDLGRQEKLVLKARGDSNTYLQLSADELARTDDPVMKAAKAAEINEHLNRMYQTGAASPEEVSKTRLQIFGQEAWNQAMIRLNAANDPVKEFARIRKESANLPLSDKMIALMNETQTLQRRAIAEAEKRMKELREQEVGANIVDIRAGKLTRPQVDAFIERNRLGREDINALYGAFEEGGLTDPTTEREIELQLKENPNSLSHRDIFTNRNLDNDTATRLSNLKKSMEEGGSSSFGGREYTLAKERIRAEVTGKGALESLNNDEQRKYGQALDELYYGVSAGRKPYEVAQDFISRLSRRGAFGGTVVRKPVVEPRWKDRQAAYDYIRAARSPAERTSRMREVETDAVLWKQHDEYNAQEQQKLLAPPTSGTSRRERQ